ncbi:MAG: 30S ribosomal protein S16 [Endomicrobium sp.]|jgi:small subunit ribosomal protein S16|nr:30S ribosomal protein S16 [Endomicrobium sp.]
MAVRLRLQRIGKIKRPYYKIVAIDKRKKRDGQAIEILGRYDPITKQNNFSIDTKRLLYWINVGATVSTRLNHLIQKIKNNYNVK